MSQAVRPQSPLAGGQAARERVLWPTVQSSTTCQAATSARPLAHLQLEDKSGSCGAQVADHSHAEPKCTRKDSLAAMFWSRCPATSATQPQGTGDKTSPGLKPALHRVGRTNPVRRPRLFRLDSPGHLSPVQSFLSECHPTAAGLHTRAPHCSPKCIHAVSSWMCSTTQPPFHTCSVFSAFKSTTVVKIGAHYLACSRQSLLHAQ